jgi:hypothetical protein
MLVQFRSTIADSWIGMEAVKIGSISSRTPDTYVTVMDENRPVLRVDVYGNSDETFCFSESTVWKGWVIIGFGHRLYFVSLSDQKTLTFYLESYFRELYITRDLLFVASASQVFCINPEGTLLWSSNILGIDGVVITKIGIESIIGKGEWDPPGGWQPFKINIKNGVMI